MWMCWDGMARCTSYGEVAPDHTCAEVRRGGDRVLTVEAARDLVASADFRWHQRFELVPGVYTPGVNDIPWLLERSGISDSFVGKTVLDIGTANGGLAFTAERLGAAHVVAVDLMPAEAFGFDVLAAALDSKVEFVQASTYELGQVLAGKFDVVVFWGVLYHLRHPLLALDMLHEVTRTQGLISIETALSDMELPGAVTTPVARFYRLSELGGDSSNWFAPNLRCVQDWCLSSGLEPYHVSAWPAGRPSRALLNVRPVEPAEFRSVSYELPLQVKPLRSL